MTRSVAAGFNAVVGFLTVVAISALAAALVFLPSRLRAQSFDPLRLPTQTVTDRVEGLSIPAVRIGDELHVQATKCNVSDQDVGVQGHSIWRSVDPAGSTVEGKTGSGIRAASPHCVSQTYANVIPDAVVARTRDLLAQGYPHVVWQLTGTETPLAPGGVAKAWATEPFALVP